LSAIDHNHDLSAEARSARVEGTKAPFMSDRAGRNAAGMAERKSREHESH
jgi:hypothetical protein